MEVHAGNRRGRGGRVQFEKKTSVTHFVTGGHGGSRGGRGRGGHSTKGKDYTRGAPRGAGASR